MRCIWWVTLALAATACSKTDPGDKPVDAKVWREKNKAALDAWQAKLAATVTLVKDLPATSVHNADPDAPFQVFLASYADVPNAQAVNAAENAVIVDETDVPGLPAYGKYRDVDVTSGDDGISVNYMGYIDFDLLNRLLETGKPKYDTTAGVADNVVKRLGKLRYLIVTRTVEYTPGTIDTAGKTFTAGTFQGVAHLVDLQGPKHLGSVTYSARNTGSFESYSGSEKYMLRADLQGEAVRAFNAEWKKVFPKLALPEPPPPDKK